MELLLILCVLCAGLSYFITRDRAPSKAPIGTMLGLILGPVGVVLTFLLKPETEDGSDRVTATATDLEIKSQEKKYSPADAVDTKWFEALSQDDQYEKVSSALRSQETAKTVEQLKAELAKMKPE